MRHFECWQLLAGAKDLTKMKSCLLLLASLCCFVSLASAQSQPSASQIKYFQSLSSSEQRKIAEQYGISLPNNNGSNTQQQNSQLPKTIYRSEYERMQQQEKGGDQQMSPSNQFDLDDQSSDELPIFGMRFFAGQATSFTPIGDLPVSADYIVSPGDEVNIQVYGKLNEQYELLVRRDGTINIPNLGPFSVVGKRFSQVREELHSKFQQQIIGAQIAVSMGELHAMQIYVLGDARQPGAYQLSSLATATQAIIAAGGIADSGSLRRIQVRRGNRLIAEVDLYDLLLHGKRGGDIRLQTGDAVFIAPAGPRVEVDGEVLRPAIYELADRETSVSEVLAYAGGSLPSAYASGVRVERLTSNGVDVFSVELNDAKSRSFDVKSGDKIFLDKRNTGYRKSIQLAGAFINAGQHGFKEGMRVADIFSAPKTILRDDADKSIALLVRKEAKQQISVHYIPISEVVAQPSSQKNLKLMPEDELLVLPSFVVQPYPEKNDEDDDTERNYSAFVDDKRGKSTVGFRQRRLERGSERGQSEATASTLSADEYRPQAETKYLSRQQRLTELMDLQEQKPLSAEEERLRKEALEDQATQELEIRRAELLAPIMEKLREQASNQSYQQTVEIAGEVKYPGSYPYMPNMSLETLIHIAGGLKENAFPGGGELARFVEDGGKISLQTNRIAIEDGAAKSTRLQARDRISIFERPEWRDTIAVRVTGEVKFPGTYTVVRGTGFKDLIQRAGGLTQFAFPEGSVFSRETLKEKEQEQIERLRNRLKEEVATLSLRKSSGISGLSVSPSEAIDAVDKLNSVEALGRLVVDLPSLLASDKTRLTLEDGDFLHIPSHSRTVTVVGEVQYPSSHLYEDDIDYKEYLQRAGGTRQRADSKRIYIIRANGQVVVPKNTWFGVDVAEGDTIVVPINAQYVDKLSVFGSVTQILYQLGIAYDVISR
jgi:polysaccharide export outer membrane protein